MKPLMQKWDSYPRGQYWLCSCWRCKEQLLHTLNKVAPVLKIYVNTFQLYLVNNKEKVSQNLTILGNKSQSYVTYATTLNLIVNTFIRTWRPNLTIKQLIKKERMSHTKEHFNYTRPLKLMKWKPKMIS
jgi:hypothetical protein